MEKNRTNRIHEGRLERYVYFIKRHWIACCAIVSALVITVILTLVRWNELSFWEKLDFDASLIGLFSVVPPIFVWFKMIHIEDQIRHTREIFGPTAASEKSAVLIITCIGGGSIAQQVENYLVEQSKKLPDDDIGKEIYLNLFGKEADVLDSTMEYKSLGITALETLEDSKEPISFKVNVKCYKDKEYGNKYLQPIVEICGPSRMPDNPDNQELTNQYIKYYRYTVENVLKKFQNDGVTAVHLFMYTPVVLGEITGSVLKNNLKTYMYHRNKNGEYCPIGLLQ